MDTTFTCARLRPNLGALLFLPVHQRRSHIFTTMSGIDNGLRSGPSSPRASVIASFKRRFSTSREQFTEQKAKETQSRSSLSTTTSSHPTASRKADPWLEPIAPSPPLSSSTSIPRRRIRVSGTRLPSGYRPKTGDSLSNSSWGSHTPDSSRSLSVMSQTKRNASSPQDSRLGSPASSALSIPSSASPGSTELTSHSSNSAISKKKTVRFSVDGPPAPKEPFNVPCVNSNSPDGLLRFGFSWKRNSRST
ncbi:hypothetical protein M422DRAFT_774666 [Sphaerobolus stellatus SS14]|nr:hypothetical protein M422DRAFT_774666 [Sphaerobolus stellatus SS14]